MQGTMSVAASGCVGPSAEHPDLKEGERRHRHTQQAVVEAGLLVVYARVRLAHKRDGQRTSNHNP